MAYITVELSESDIHAALKDYAVTHVLNEGRHTSGDFQFIEDQTKPTGKIISYIVNVETERMSKAAAPRHATTPREE